MADGAQRIADFMGNAGCESSEGGELELLGLLGDLRDVLEEHQSVELVAVLQGGETRLQRRSAGVALRLAGAVWDCHASAAVP